MSAWGTGANAGAKNKSTPSLFSPPPFVSPFGHKRWVSTRGKCSNSPISLLERAHRFLLPSFPLCSSASLLSLSWFLFLISPSLFDLRWGGGDAALPSSPHTELTIFLPASPLCWAFAECTSLKVIYSQLSSRCSHVYLAREEEQVLGKKELNLHKIVFFFFFVITTWNSNALEEAE